MAKKIELGLQLDDKDAVSFHENAQNPNYSERTKKILNEAHRLSKSRGKR